MINKKLLVLFLIFTVSLMLTYPAAAHFQLILPSDDTIDRTESAELSLQLIFTHPMAAGPTMEMKKPVRFGVVNRGKTTDLLSTLKAAKFKGKQIWQASYQTKAPGDYVFYLEPAPYFESSEDKYITQFTKIVVNKMGMPTDWDSELGLPAEIIPLTRPYGLWTGNSFRGIVKRNGKVVPDAEIEIEYLNTASFSDLNDNSLNLPAPVFENQVVKTDQNGVFVYTIPRAGWWGFSALLTGDKVKNKDHEVGAIIWVKAYNFD
ncbi:DUF4198 domain-containing protein [Halanaerobium salsuginis]|jgi:cobalt/nickel transport protein|uniref:Cobalt/nickel transport protein n=1 Tax=Halanaerobium salsuginis TaxID=29563 RepID=A0A1I4K593_9FIRM|nr:DUF4198 domain-containing protein [Halanaerobium salsuginis]SFL73771.1 cobalt/nickel transport protein [Halanaerobium salsuginis]